ncbi:hypothetical protein AB4Z22_15105, partial [Paenibacillus sp. TAF58]
MEVKDKVKQRRIERLRNLRETSDPSNGSGSPRIPTRNRGNSLPIHPHSEVPLYVDPELKRRMEDPEYAWQQKLLMDPDLVGRDYLRDGERGLL